MERMKTMDITSPPESIDKISTGRLSEETSMAIQSVGYKAKAFESRNLVFFFLIAFGWSWFWWGLFIFNILKIPSGIGTSEVDLRSAGPLILIIALSPYGPTLAGFVMTAITEGRTGVKALWKRFWNRDLSIKWLFVTLLFFPAFQLIANFVSRTLDGLAHPFLTYPNQPWMFIPPFIANTLISAGMSEEFGWRGYVLPRFQAKWNALTSSIILGVIWAAWHIPLWFVPGDSHNQVFFWGWVGRIILLSILMTWIFNNTNGSVLATILFHGMANSASDLFQYSGSEWYYIGVRLIVVVLIVFIFGPKNLVRGPSEETRISPYRLQFTK
jgi:membrane protease YdiL (CAAX protease family)